MRLLALALLSGCQCFQPVFEDLDAGVNDAGLDAGRPECARAADCPAVSATPGCAFSSGAPSRSCYDGRCVFDCEGPRTCSTGVGSCLACDGGAPNCTGASCSLVDDGATGRIYRTCEPGSYDELGTFRVRYRTGATCNFVVISGDGGVFGALDLLGSETTGSAEVTEEPQVTCTVRGLATALNRVELGCARCLYVLEWP